MIKFLNRYTINKIAPDCLSIQYRGNSIDIESDTAKEDSKYYYAAERQCKDARYELKGIFRKRLIKHSYTRDLYFGIVSSCVKSIMRTSMPSDKVGGAADDINQYQLLMHSESANSTTIQCIIIKKLPETDVIDLFYETIDDLGIDPEKAEMIDLGLYNDHDIEFYLKELGFQNRILQYRFKAIIEYPYKNGHIYNIYTSKDIYDTPMIPREDVLICSIK